MAEFTIIVTVPDNDAHLIDDTIFSTAQTVRADVSDILGRCTVVMVDNEGNALNVA